MTDHRTADPSGSGADRLPTTAVAGGVVASLSLIVIGIITLSGAGGSVKLPFWCMRCGLRPALDILLNVVLFVPLGLGLGLGRTRLRWATLVVLAVTCSVEALQFAVVPGRFASARDILTNTAGGIIGFCIARDWRGLVLPPPRRALLLGGAAILLWLATQLFTAWALVVAVPDGTWWAQVSRHDRGFPAHFPGRVVRLSIGSSAILYSDTLQDSERARSEWVRGAPVAAVVTSTPENSGPAPILVIAADATPTEVIALAQQGTGVFFRVRTRAAVIGLRNPAILLGDVFLPGSEADTITVSARYSDGEYEIDSERGGGRRQFALAASASWLWALLMPLRHSTLGAESRWITVAWLFIALALPGFWLAQWDDGESVHSRRRIAVVALFAGGLFIGLALVPLTFGLSRSHWSEWLAAAGGAAAGMVSGSLLRRAA